MTDAMDINAIAASSTDKLNKLITKNLYKKQLKQYTDSISQSHQSTSDSDLEDPNDNDVYRRQVYQMKRKLEAIQKQSKPSKQTVQIEQPIAVQQNDTNDTSETIELTKFNGPQYEDEYFDEAEWAAALDNTNTTHHTDTTQQDDEFEDVSDIENSIDMSIDTVNESNNTSLSHSSSNDVLDAGFSIELDALHASDSDQTNQLIKQMKPKARKINVLTGQQIRNSKRSTLIYNTVRGIRASQLADVLEIHAALLSLLPQKLQQVNYITMTDKTTKKRKQHSHGTDTYDMADIDKAYIQSLLRWFTDTFTCTDRSGELLVHCSSTPIRVLQCATNQLLHCIEHKQGNGQQLVILFTALCRTLHIGTRICHSFPEFIRLPDEYDTDRISTKPTLRQKIIAMLHKPHKCFCQTTTHILPSTVQCNINKANNVVTVNDDSDSDVAEIIDLQSDANDSDIDLLSDLQRPQRKQRPTTPLDYLLEPLKSHPSYYQRILFGHEGIYLDAKQVLVLCCKEEPWNGLLIPTDRPYHQSLIKQFPALQAHAKLGKWLYLSKTHTDFDTVAKQIVELILTDDKRIGVESTATHDKILVQRLQKQNKSTKKEKAFFSQNGSASKAKAVAAALKRAKEHDTSTSSIDINNDTTSNDITETADAKTKPKRTRKKSGKKSDDVIETDATTNSTDGTTNNVQINGEQNGVATVKRSRKKSVRKTNGVADTDSAIDHTDTTNFTMNGNDHVDTNGYQSDDSDVIDVTPVKPNTIPKPTKRRQAKRTTIQKIKLDSAEQAKASAEQSTVTNTMIDTNAIAQEQKRIAEINGVIEKVAKKSQRTKRTKTSEPTADSSMLNDIDSDACQICGNGDSTKSNSILLCDQCDCGYHCKCLTPPLTKVPSGTWYCHRCSNTDETTVDHTILPHNKRDRNPIQQLSKTANKNVCSWWCELYSHTEKRWLYVDVCRILIDDTKSIEIYLPYKLTYVIAYRTPIDVRTHTYNEYKFGRANTVVISDVTKRYTSNWMKVSKNRIDEKWWQSCLHSVTAQPESYMKSIEINDIKSLNNVIANESIPTTLNDLKNHPLYITPIHCKKYEYIYPNDESAIVSTIEYKNELHPIYPRSNLYTLHTAERWTRELRQVKPDEQPMKTVNALKYVAERRDDPNTYLYGIWQTEPLIVPHAVDGQVPLNERGQVDLWTEKHLPVGCTHLNYPRIIQTVKKLGIHFGAAMTGFDVRGGRSIPRFEGIVVCSEYVDTIMHAYNQSEQLAAERREQRRLDSIYKSWNKLMRSIIIKQRVMKDLAQKGYTIDIANQQAKQQVGQLNKQEAESEAAKKAAKNKKTKTTDTVKDETNENHVDTVVNNDTTDYSALRYDDTHIHIFDKAKLNINTNAWDHYCKCGMKNTDEN